MLIPAKEISRIWGIKPNSILHVGAHHAEELEEYKSLEWANQWGVIWVEAQESLISNLKALISGSNSKVIHAAIWDEDDKELEFKITNNSQSSSLLNLGTHKTNYPDIGVTQSVKIFTKRLDTVLEADSKIEFLNLDIQGVELRALKGLGMRISDVRWIYTEVNSQMVYKECALISDIDIFLKDKGFTRVATFWVAGRGWGDALYIGNYFEIPFRKRLTSKFKFLSWKFQQEAKRVISDYWNTFLFRTKIKKRLV